MDNHQSTDRREFLKDAAVASAGLALAAGYSGSVAGQEQAADSEKFPPVKLGVIGLGMMGERHITRLLELPEYVQITAVCDVYTKWLSEQASRTGADSYQDYRKLLEAKNVDAVLIATPDHWHAKMCVDAADAGKDIYCEKPMTHWRDLQEAKDVVEAVRRNQRVMQVGVQSTSDARWTQAQEFLRAGRVGKMMRAQATYARNGDHHKYDPASVESGAIPGETLDWDMWLGPAPKIPFDMAHFASFRSFFDYSGGVVTDLLAHRITPLAMAMEVGFPHRVSSTGGKYFFTDRREIPDVVNVTVEYPGGPSAYFMSGMACPNDLPTQVEGPKGTLHFTGSGFDVRDAGGEVVETVASERAPVDSEQRTEHAKNLFHCIHTREKPICDEYFGYQIMTVLHMAVRSYLEGKVYEFDPKTEEARAV